MKTYLLVWNPKKWTWKNLESDIEDVNKTGRCSENWSFGRNKSIEVGDRIFLIKVGTEPKGIMGACYSTTKPYHGKHWSGVYSFALTGALIAIVSQATKLIHLMGSKAVSLDKILIPLLRAL